MTRAIFPVASATTTPTIFHFATLQPCIKHIIRREADRELFCGFYCAHRIRGLTSSSRRHHWAILWNHMRLTRDTEQGAECVIFAQMPSPCLKRVISHFYPTHAFPTCGVGARIARVLYESQGMCARRVVILVFMQLDFWYTSASTDGWSSEPRALARRIYVLALARLKHAMLVLSISRWRWKYARGSRKICG